MIAMKVKPTRPDNGSDELFNRGDEWGGEMWILRIV
jgi:hypothetical protein